MRTCYQCHEEKPLDAFYKHPAGAGGRMTKCADCHRENVKRRRRVSETAREYDRKRTKTPERQAHLRENARKWREAHPERYKAQSAVSNAIRDGRLKREPCYFCGDGRVHAHHHDYAKPLTVVWLCPKCHHRLHALEAAGQGANG